MRICLVFDCLYPHTVGGAERWYRNLAESLAHRGHTVTYLTLLQWDRATGAGVPNMDVVAVAGRAELYAHGRRSIGAQIRFAFGVWRHLLAHGGRYDVVQTPALHVSLLAVLAARPIRRFALVVDWFEVWTREYWLGYLGGVAGRLGWWGQRISARAKHHALCFSRRHARRLEQIGYRGQITLLEGLLPPGKEAAERMPAELTVVFAGRLIPEKQATALVPAVALARQRVPELRATIFGDGPERDALLRLIDESGLDGAVQAPGFVAATVVVDAPDNAAVELVEDGVNGFVARSAEPKELGEAILRVHAAGPALRESTADWFRRNRERLSLETSVERVLAVYGRR
ncbi:MAG: glycosyltransferase family 4 protein [Actinobacteria bacterium]|nr:MAG: glycosyltransferase family 4 protein [Actinomycetota bacterium]